MKGILLKIKKEKIIVIVSLIGIIARVIMGLKQIPNYMQHDVMSENGHIYYAVHIFNNWSLPTSNAGEFYHPPLNAIMQAVFMKFVSLFIKAHNITNKDLYNEYILKLYTSTRILSIIYSVVTLIIIIKILDLFEIRKHLISENSERIFSQMKTNTSLKCAYTLKHKLYYLFTTKNIKVLIASICAIYPSMILMAGQYTNDGLAYMFFFLSIFFSLQWYKEQKVITIVLLALSIGLGMLSKMTVAMVAFIVAPIIIIALYKNFDKKNVLQFVVFAIIVFPIGLFYPIRNYIMFGKKIGYILDPGKNLPLYVGNKDIFERFLSLPLHTIYSKKNGIYCKVGEPNIWINLFKTATYDDYIYDFFRIITIHFVLLILNVLFFIFTIASFFYSLISDSKSMIKK